MQAAYIRFFGFHDVHALEHHSRGSSERSGRGEGTDLLHAAAVRFWFCLPCGVVRLVA